MLDNLIQLVKEHAGEAIINNPVIPNERNDEAIQTASDGILDGLRKQAGNGGLDQITSLFSGGNVTSNSAFNGIAESVSEQLMGKFGIDKGAAGNIVSNLLPVVMDKFVSKTNDPNDSSFDLGDIMKNIGAGGSGGIGGMLSNLFGK
jgi:uncharacterized protein YidB (DUF937 family)